MVGMITVGAAIPIACGNGSTGPELRTVRVLAVGVARQDVSPQDPLEGFLVFFYDLQADSLLTADARVLETSGIPVDTIAVATPLVAGFVPGVVYVQGANVLSGATYRLAATLTIGGSPVEILSEPVTVPAVFEIEVPDRHAIGDSLTVNWEPTPDASSINVSAGSGFTVDVPAAQTGVTIPPDAFAGLVAGAMLEIEVTAYNQFYIPLAGGIASLSDAEAFAERLRPVENIDGADGAGGAFGAATTVGRVVTLE